VNALAFTPGDASELARHIEVLARDPNLRERLGRAGRSTAEQRFHRRRMASELAPIYESLVH
jgi:glycosyltransferase involved in cell wall biosynthesis